MSQWLSHERLGWDKRRPLSAASRLQESDLARDGRASPTALRKGIAQKMFSVLSAASRLRGWFWGSVPRHKCRGNSVGICVECYALSDVRASVTEKQQTMGGGEDQLQLSAISYQLSANTTFENLSVAGFCHADRPLTQVVQTRPPAHAGGSDFGPTAHCPLAQTGSD